MSSVDIDKLVSEMTLPEKVKMVAGKDMWHTTDIKRLGIPSVRVSDGPNGVRGTKLFRGVPAGCFPCGTGLGATFDKELLLAAGELMGKEAKTKSAAVILGPTTNMQRSPIGGRGFESFSEDPVLSGFCGAAIINGIQSQGIAATLKHYVANELEDDRQAVDAIITERALRELYLLPFQIAIRDSSPKVMMTALNKVNGEHVAQSKKFLTDILREEWGWDGTIMSDWTGIYSLREAIEGGLDFEMPGPPLMRKVDAVTHSVNTKELHIRYLNERVKGVLKLVKYAMENSGISLDNLTEDDSNNTPETASALRKLAQESIVLLKNENSFLPLNKEEKIAVIGGIAKYSAYCGGGSASLTAYYTTTPFQGISSKLDYTPSYNIGAPVYKNLPGLVENLVQGEDGSMGFSVKIYDKPVECEDRNLLETTELTSSQHFMFGEVVQGAKDGFYYLDAEGYLIPEESGNYVFGLIVCGTGLLYIDDQLVVDNKTKQSAGPNMIGFGTVEEKGSMTLNKGQKYKIRLEFGSGRTATYSDIAGILGGGAFQVGFIREVDENEQIQMACEIAKSADKVVVCVGLSQEFESEGFDRPDMDLPGATNKLIQEVLKVQPNVIVVNQSGTPVAMPWYDEVPAIIQAWFGGNEGGNAIGDVLFGDVNPSGKLSLTFPLKIQDNPTYLNFKSNNGKVLYGEDIYIGYKYYEMVERKVMFPFGHGLSYTSFEFSNLVISEKGPDWFIVSVEVKNTGTVDGSEVVQIYVSQQKTSITRPKKELKDFAKVQLKAGESKIVTVETSVKYATSFYHEYEDCWCSEKGMYDVFVGNSSNNTPLKAVLEVGQTTFWRGV